MKTVLAVIALCSLVVGQAAYSGSGSYSGSAVYSFGSTINAASCSASDVQTACSGATSATTQISIPAGTCHWTAQVLCPVPTGSATLSILGAGSLTTTGGGDATVIIDDYTSTSPFFRITTGAAASHFRLAGLTFQGGTGDGAGNSKSGGVQILGFSQNLRIDHVHFNNLTYSPAESGAQLVFQNWIYGVIDHSIFDLTALNGAANGFWSWDEAYNGETAGIGDNAWAAPSALGTSAFLFAEDDVFNGGAANDCSHGGRWVIRHSTFNNGAALQTHPTGGAGRSRGCRAWELYDNSFSGSNTTPDFNAFFLSSGTGVIWGNSAPNGYETFVSLHSVRRNVSDYPAQTPTPGGWGMCGTSYNGTGSNWDQNTSSTTGYACIDQPGRGQGDQLSGYFPNAINNTTGTIAWPHEALEPVYEWMDSWTPAPGYGYGFFLVPESDVEVQNQDWYNWCNASSPTGCTSFTGATTLASSTNGGVGSGLLSARPSTCTPMVAYWATDTNTLYQCSATNTWTVYYTPYTYPHPLTQGSGGGA